MTAHLTYERVKIYDKGKSNWEYIELYKELATIYNSFIDVFHHSKRIEFKIVAHKIPITLDELLEYEKTNQELSEININSNPL